MYHTFVDYNEANNQHNAQPRHKVMLNLVKKHAKNVEPEYRSLYDNCLTARYSDYRISPEIALLSKENLAVIKSHSNPSIDGSADKVVATGNTSSENR